MSERHLDRKADSLASLLSVLLGIAGMASAACAQIAPEARPWGDVADGLQLQLSTGTNTEQVTETWSRLILTVMMRNTSGKPVFASMEGGQADFNFEYEIDGAWYAFEPLAPVPTVGTTQPWYASTHALQQTLAARSPSLQLHAITTDGPGKRFEPTPGPHVVRVRPGRAVIGDRPVPISNAVSVVFGKLSNPETRNQTVTFIPARDTPLRELHFAAGPADAQAFIRAVLARPPYGSLEPWLITAAALQVFDPLPFYELWLPQPGDGVAAVLPTSATRYHYLLQAAEKVVGSVGINPTTTGLVFSSLDTIEYGADVSVEPLYRALQQLAGMKQVRGAGYEPRLLKVSGREGAWPLLVVWLHSKDRPDLFYLLKDPQLHSWMKLESGKVYRLDAFLKDAQTLPVAPKRDQAWALRTALACAKAKRETSSEPLLVDQATVEMGLSQKQDRIIWYVFIPSPMDEDVIEIPLPGVAFAVDESNGSCGLIIRE